MALVGERRLPLCEFWDQHLPLSALAAGDTKAAHDLSGPLARHFHPLAVVVALGNTVTLSRGSRGGDLGEAAWDD